MTVVQVINYNISKLEFRNIINIHQKINIILGKKSIKP